LGAYLVSCFEAWAERARLLHKGSLRDGTTCFVSLLSRKQACLDSKEFAACWLHSEDDEEDPADQVQLALEGVSSGSRGGHGVLTCRMHLLWKNTFSNVQKIREKYDIECLDVYLDIFSEFMF
jgi:hypothetical protein